MKKYRTIDLLKAVYDGKIFKNKLKNIKTGEVIYQGKKIDPSFLKDTDQTKRFFRQCGINFAVGKTGTTLDFTHFLEEEWEEVQEPVSFMEAIKAYNEGRTIQCMYINNYTGKGDTLITHTYKPHATNILIDENRSHPTIWTILTGKWYIKEDEETTTTDKTKFIEINYKDLRDQERRTKYFTTQEEYEKWHEENWDYVVIND